MSYKIKFVAYLTEKIIINHIIVDVPNIGEDTTMKLIFDKFSYNDLKNLRSLKLCWDSSSPGHNWVLSMVHLDEKISIHDVIWAEYRDQCLGDRM